MAIDSQTPFDTGGSYTSQRTLPMSTVALCCLRWKANELPPLVVPNLIRSRVAQPFSVVRVGSFLLCFFQDRMKPSATDTPLGSRQPMCAPSDHLGSRQVTIDTIDDDMRKEQLKLLQPLFAPRPRVDQNTETRANIFSRISLHFMQNTISNATAHTPPIHIPAYFSVTKLLTY